MHREHCSADGTNRYAVHIAMNRTMLDGTGRRLDEGRAAVAKAKRTQAMREMDSRWGLQQVKANERNSAIHARQPTKAERKMAERGIESEKAFIKKRVKERVSEIRAEGFEGNRMRELSRRLVPDGVKMTVSKSGKQVQFKTGRLTVNGNKLGRGSPWAGSPWPRDEDRGWPLPKALSETGQLRLGPQVVRSEGVGSGTRTLPGFPLPRKTKMEMAAISQILQCSLGPRRPHS